MSDDSDVNLVNLLWLIKGGRLKIKNNGKGILSIRRAGEDPEIDILDMDYIMSIMPRLSLPVTERMRKLSRSLARSEKNVRITLDGDNFMNLGRDETILGDLEGFADIFLKRIKKKLRRD